MPILDRARQITGLEETGWMSDRWQCGKGQRGHAEGPTAAWFLLSTEEIDPSQDQI